MYLANGFAFEFSSRSGPAGLFDVGGTAQNSVRVGGREGSTWPSGCSPTASTR